MPGAVGIHAAANPDGRFIIQRQNDHLRNIKRPAVVTGQVIHVCRIGYDQNVDALFGHAHFGFAHPLLIFLDVKQCHETSSMVFIVGVEKTRAIYPVPQEQRRKPPQRMRLSRLRK